MFPERRVLHWASSAPDILSPHQRVPHSLPSTELTPKMATQVPREASLQASGSPGTLASHPPPTFLPDPQSPGAEDALRLSLPQSLCAHFPGTGFSKASLPARHPGAPRVLDGVGSQQLPLFKFQAKVHLAHHTVAPKTNTHLRQAFSVLFLPRLKLMTLPAPTPKYLSLVIILITRSSCLSSTYYNPGTLHP